MSPWARLEAIKPLVARCQEERHFSAAPLAFSPTLPVRVSRWDELDSSKNIDNDTAQGLAVTIGQAGATLVPTIYRRHGQPLPPVLFSLLCGVTVPHTQIPGAFRGWLYWLNISGLVVNELEGPDIRCLDSEYRTITPPAGQTCGDWLNPYVEQAGGYILDANASGSCSYCQYSQGSDFFIPLGQDFSKRGNYIGYFVCYCVFNCFLTVFGARFLTFRYSKR